MIEIIRDSLQQPNRKYTLMKTLNSFLLIGLIFMFLSCENGKKTTDKNTQNSEEQKDSRINHFDRELEEALYNGHFIKNEKGYDIAISGNTLYLLRANPSEPQENERFFMHIIPKNGKLLNLDFSSTEYLLTNDLSDNFAKVRIYKRELPEVEGSFDINLGQFEGDQRSWESYITMDLLNNEDNLYQNEYVDYTKSNRYLETFKMAFDQGYFMKHQDGYDLLVDDHTLYYICSDKAKANLAYLFFLHVKFDGKEEFLNLDFNGKNHEIDQLLGPDFASFVVIKREIPNNGKITEVATGQFDGDERLWSYVYQLENLYDDISFIYNGHYGEVLK